jgi:hypothetical protein
MESSKASRQTNVDVEFAGTPVTYSLFFLSSESPLRRTLVRISDSKKTESIIIILIIVASVILILQNPLNDPNSEYTLMLKKLDLILTGIFTLEVCLKVLAYGFRYCGSKSYLRNSWNVLDFSIVVTCLISILLPDSFLEMFVILRLIRLLRPLRLIGKNDGLKTSIKALLVALPAIFSQSLIVMFFYLIFAIIGVNLYKGRHEYCLIDHLVGLSDEQKIGLINTSTDCLNYGGEWQTQETNFNTIDAALMQIFSLSQTCNWMFDMHLVQDSRGPGFTPRTKNDPTAAVFYVAAVFFCSFFVFNMFVGVVVAAYNRESERLGRKFLLTEQQKSWIETKMKALSIKPKIKLSRPVIVSWRKPFFDLAEHRFSEKFVYSCIFINTLVLAIKWIGQPKEVTTFVETMNYIFTTFFIFEATTKIIGYGRYYFKDNWNKFDFGLAFTSGIFTLMQVLIGLKMPQSL